jgi:glycosyltransferase involved in cell wall biosynthesis
MLKQHWTPRPPVTVLMAVFNTPAEELRTAAFSICEQTWRDFEFLILDDGSTNPQTIQELQAIAQSDPRVRLERHSNIGLTRSLNRGLELARGKWIARQDGDDWSEPTRLARQLEYLRRSSRVELCGTNAWTHQRTGRRLWPTRLPENHEDILAAFETRNPFVHGAAMFLSSRARELGGYREQFRCSQDFDFFWRFAGAARVANLRDALYHYRYSGSAVSATRAYEQAMAHAAALKLAASRRAGLAEDVESAFADARQEMAQNAGYRAALKQADHLLLAGEYRQAGQAFCDLLRARPWSGIAWGKLARWVVFSTLPPLRQGCFR